MASSDKKKYINRREEKSRDIKKALTHRARIRKNYFKLLKTEGYEERNKDESNDHEDQPKRKPINFQERAAIAKKRKDENRKLQLEKIQDKLKTIETKNRERQFKKDQFKQSSNQKGQPLMGPRINNLLDKIKNDQSI
ncbi:unnamed protein product [Candida verbasci]|uniref:rRNA-processing protein FYV7 n=1 Tax=Candida verbasci TaxID=1227364 RepID=A0A9W4TZC0_9ASCO|nr:unnamed protein product [Candida verbasci]